MKSIGIICEFNPLHNGHIHFIKEIKNKYKDSIIILVLNGYFLQRGEVSILSKEDKTKLSLKHGVDIVIELPVLFGTQSADTFASKSVELLNNLSVEKIIFGSESNDVSKIYELAQKQINNEEYNNEVKMHLKSGINYPTALAKALKKDDFLFTPNDILGISYIKSVITNNYNIVFETIKRTNDFHDNKLDSSIVSASNIREKIKNNILIEKYMPKDVVDKLTSINKEIYFSILKTKILTEKDLSLYLDVDEGIENKLKKDIINATNIDEFVKKIKTKRFTYNKINRMLVHILLGILKEDAKTKLSYSKILGFTEYGQKYINGIKKDVTFPLITDKKNLVYDYEIKASIIYGILTNKKTYDFEKNNKPIK